LRRRIFPRDSGLRTHRVVDSIGKLGNTSAATLPLALQYSIDAGQLRDGDRVRCSRSEHKVSLFHTETDFFHVLRTKLKWGER